MDQANHIAQQRLRKRFLEDHWEGRPVGALGTIFINATMYHPRNKPKPPVKTSYKPKIKEFAYE